MSSLRNKRILKEFTDLTSRIIPDWVVKWDESDDQCDLRWLIFHLIGRPETPYENGKFQLLVTFPVEYPLKCPEFRFRTRIFHPSVAKDGSLSISYFNDYLATTSMRQLLQSIAKAIYDPNKDDILNQKAAFLYDQKPASFERIAATWTLKYALDEETFSNASHSSSSREIISPGRTCLNLPHLYAASPHQRLFQPIDHSTREFIKPSSKYITDEKLITESVFQPEKSDVIKTEITTSLRCRTILKEFIQVRNNMKPEWCVEAYYPNDLNRWRLYWNGRDGTPYEKGNFQLSVKFPTEYPLKCPDFRFDTLIFHPSVDEDGFLSISFFTDYLPTTSMCTLLQSIAEAICNPNKDDILDPYAAFLYDQRPALFEQIAAKWTLKYANEEEIISDKSDSPPPSEIDPSEKNSLNPTRASSPCFYHWSYQQIDQNTQELIGQLQYYTRDKEVAIERAFHRESSIVELDGALISFSHGLQVSKDNNIYRVNRHMVKRDKLRRRYTHLACYNCQSAYENPFIKDVLDASVDISIANVVAGILKEGSLRNQELQAEDLVRELRVIGKNDTVLSGLECIKIYTSPSFLFKSVNKFLRERDYTKLDILGPYCKLLWSQFNKYKANLNSLKVYRGDDLRAHDLRAYKRGVGKKPYQWLGFTSTSKSEETAKAFRRNTFFIIRLEKVYNDGRALDIQKLSDFDEDEVLLRPGVEFTIEKFEYDENMKINTFYLTAYI